MIQSETRCAFLQDNNRCAVLEVEECTTHEGCNFYQTKHQLTESRDKTIDVCRAKGYCNSCKYTNFACRKSTEEQNSRKKVANG